MSCVKSVSVAKSVPQVKLVPPAGCLLPVKITVTTRTGAGSVPCGVGVCNMPATVLGGMIEVSISNAGPTPGPFTAMVALPMRASGTVINDPPITVNVFLPGGIVPGVYAVTAKVTVNFSMDGSNPPQTYCATGDSVVCIVEPVPGDPNVPRLEASVIGAGGFSDNQLCLPGEQYTTAYLVRNNDPLNDVTLMVTGTSRQNARTPQDPGNPGQPSAYAISGITGDDFPIEFAENLPPGGVLPLPPVPSAYTQPPIQKMITIPALGQEVVYVATRSYTACASGSCGEYTLTVQGNFQNGDPALACVGTAVTVSEQATPHIPVWSGAHVGAALLGLGVLLTVLRRSRRRLCEAGA